VLTRFSLAFVLLAGVACAGTGPGAGPAPEPGAEQEPGVEQPGVVPDSTCENTSGGNPENFPPFTEVELESGVDSGDTDRITFRFVPQSGAPDDAPLYFINFTDKLITDGEGRPVRAEGEAFVVVSFQAVGVELSGEKPVEVYTGPKRFTPDFGVLREAVHLGDFEGQVSWGLGLSRESCFRLIAARDQIALEFPAA
jgi:hypothetical protein